MCDLRLPAKLLTQILLLCSTPQLSYKPWHAVVLSQLLMWMHLVWNAPRDSTDCPLWLQKFRTFPFSISLDLMVKDGIRPTSRILPVLFPSVPRWESLRLYVRRKHPPLSYAICLKSLQIFQVLSCRWAHTWCISWLYGNRHWYNFQRVEIALNVWWIACPRSVPPTALSNLKTFRLFTSPWTWLPVSWASFLLPALQLPDLDHKVMTCQNLNFFSNCSFCVLVFPSSIAYIRIKDHFFQMSIIYYLYDSSSGSSDTPVWEWR